MNVLLNVERPTSNVQLRIVSSTAEPHSIYSKFSVGRSIFDVQAKRLRFQFRKIEPLALLGAFDADFGELHALSTFEECPAEWLVEHDVA